MFAALRSASAAAACAARRAPSATAAASASAVRCGAQTPVPLSLSSPLSALPCPSFHRSIAHGSDRHKGQRAKRQNADDEDDTVDAEAEEVVERSAEEKRAAREAKRARRAASAQAALEAQAAERRAKKAAERAAGQRAALREKASVTEKEVPLMDLSGLSHGQNKHEIILKMMRSYNFPEEVIADMRQLGDYATGSTREILSARLANIRHKFQRKPGDTGSPEVQVAMLTERLKGYDRHMLEHRTDINSRRGFLAAWHRRRKLLKYMRRTNYEAYAYVMRELNLNEADIDTVGLSRTSGTQAARIKED